MPVAGFYFFLWMEDLNSFLLYSTEPTDVEINTGRRSRKKVLRSFEKIFAVEVEHAAKKQSVKESKK